MRQFVFFLFFLLSTAGSSQEFEVVDGKVLRYPRFTSLEALGYRIMNDFQTDSERVRAAFIWVTHHIRYDNSFDHIFQTRYQFSYQSEDDKQRQIDRLVGTRVDRAFELRKGVCMDYSLLLNALCMQFEVPTRVVKGIGKTDIRVIGGEPVYKNHTWNVVQIDGQWKLLDPTWAAGYMDLVTKTFVHRYMDHYFFTPPSDFVKHHLPAKPEWQLLTETIDARKFFEAPIFLPDFFDKGIELSANTRGILRRSDSKSHFIHFKKLPSLHTMHYTIGGVPKFRRMGFKKSRNHSYISRFRLRNRLYRNHDVLTVYMGEKPILNFRIEE